MFFHTVRLRSVQLLIVNVGDTLISNCNVNLDRVTKNTRRLCYKINHNILLLFINAWHLETQWYQNKATKAQAKVNPKITNKLLKYKQCKCIFIQILFTFRKIFYHHRHSHIQHILDSVCTVYYVQSAIMS